MLSAIRTNFSKGLSRLVLIAMMLLLIASFALFGIQDVFRGFTNREVVNVGGESISVETFSQLYRQRLQHLSQRFNQVITPATAKLLGMDKQILNGLVEETSLNLRAKAYGLSLDPVKIAQSVKQDPTFQDQAGVFDPLRFGQLLRANGMNEAGFLAAQGETYPRRQLDEALAGGEDAPKVLQEAVNRFSEETRNISYITLTDAVVGTVPAPDAAALQKHYDEHKSEFRTTEFRKFTYVFAAPKDLAAKQVVTDDDAKTQYEGAKAQRYTTPEKRTYQQIVFPNAADAKTAADRLAAGTVTFEALATERGIKPEDLTIGSFAKSKINDPAIADAVFNLKEGGISPVINGKLITVIVRVSKIDPLAVTPFETLKDKIKQEIATQRGAKELADLRKTVEDERIGGTPLAEIAPRLGLKPVTVESVDARGKDPKGQPVTVPQQIKLIADVFTKDVGGDIETLDARADGVVWYAVDSATPERDRTLDEAKADITTAWTAAEKARLLQVKAAEMVKDLSGGKSLDDVAKAATLEVKQAWNIKRQGDAQGLSPTAVALTFATPAKGYATALSGNPGERIVFQVIDQIIPAFDPTTAQSKSVGKQLGQSLAQDLSAQYAEQVKTEVGVSVNQANLDRIVGGSEN